MSAAKRPTQIRYMNWQASPEGKAMTEKLHEEWSNSKECKAQLERARTNWQTSPEGIAISKANAKKMAEVWTNSSEGKAQSIAIGKKFGPITGKVNLHEWSYSPEGKAFASALGKKWGSSLEHKMRAKEWANTPEGKAHIWKMNNAQKNSPTSLEQRAFAVFLHYGLPFDFVGDRRNNPIGGKYPDFVHQTEKIVVEVCNKKEKEYRQKKPWQLWEKERIAHFNKFGYTCIVIWEDMSDEEMVISIGSFLRSSSKVIDMFK